VPELVPLPPEDYDDWFLAARGRLIAARQSTDFLPPDRAVEVVDGLLERLLPEELGSPEQHVLVGAGVTVWFCGGPDPTVLDLHAPGRELHGLRATEGAARDRGVQRLKAVAFAGQPDLAAAFAAAGYTAVATHMWRRIDAPRDAGRQLSLTDMTCSERETFTAHEAESYAADMVAAGLLGPDQAAEEARVQVAQHLADPAGRLFTGRGADGLAVGDLWLELTPPTAFVLQVTVRADQRGRGHGRNLMLAAEGAAREAGAGLLGLSVFGDNVVARGLYDSLGYATTETMGARDL
jgi:ribosomal protein S18 acetylase RimI-like enzyme